MALQSKAYSKRQKQFRKAISFLVEQELYSSAMQIMWLTVRDSIFYFLEERKLIFDSTQEAIYLFISIQESFDNKKCIYCAYTNSIINEWDTNTSITKSDYNVFEQYCLTINEIVSNG